MKPYLSVVIPAYNEEANLRAGVLDSVYNYLRRQKYSWEVVIVDDGSNDSTAEIVEEFAVRHRNFRLLKEPHRGKGGAITAGVLASKGQIILFTDMDQATPIQMLDRLLPEFKKGFEIIIGSRTGRRGAPLARKIMAAGFVVLRTLLFRLPYKDTQCGFKAFKKLPAREIFKRLKVFGENIEISGASVTAGFDVEVLYIARKLGFKISEVDVVWNFKQTKKVNMVRDSIGTLIDLLRIRINAFKGAYGV